MSWLEAVCREIERSTAKAARPAGSRAVAGGSINETRLLELRDGRRFFVKSNAGGELAHVFEREAEGLEALRRAAQPIDGLRVPAAVGQGEANGRSFLVLEAIETGRAGPSFHADFGRALAELHRGSAGERYGFENDNYLGATPQPNAWTGDWVDFWRRHRLGDQLERAQHAGLADRTLDRLGQRLLDRLDDFLPPHPHACLLHGDLWGGNYLVDEQGRAVLIDPAAYYGHREADIAMTRLFGGFPPAFERAYEQAWPFEPGSAPRLLIYELHHLLNHLNLFGRGYLGSCHSHLRRLVG